MPPLSEESLQHIFLQLRLGEEIVSTMSRRDGQVKTDRLTLRNLALASKTFNRLTQPILYQTFMYEDVDDSHSLAVLLRTFARKPQLARYTNEACMSVPNEELECSHYLIRNPALQTCLTDTGRYNNLSTELHQRVFTGLEAGSQGAACALLLRLCVNLTKLEVKVSPGASGPYGLAIDLVQCLGLGYENATPSTPAAAEEYQGLGFGHPLQRLRFLHLKCADWDKMSDCGRLSPFLRFPSLETVDGTWMFAWSGSDFAGATSSSLRRLRLKDSVVDGHGATALLRARPALEELCIHWSYSFSGSNGHFFYTAKNTQLYQPIGEALRQYGTFLKNLGS